jgi:probable HAF family extracellular repeat protein
MKLRRDLVNFRNSILAAIALAILCFATVRPAAAQTTYTVTDLGTLGGTFSWAFGVSPQGWASGFSTLPGDTTTHAFRWRNGTMTDLGTLGGTLSAAYGVNVWTRVVGISTNADETEDRAFLYVFGNMQDLGTLAAGNVGNSIATAISIRNWVVGAAETSSIDPNFGVPQVHPFLWIKGTMSDLGTLGGFNGEAEGTNAWGQVVGDSDTTFTLDPILGIPPFHAALWSNGMMTDLGTLGGKRSTAYDINKLGQVVGVSSLVGESPIHAFWWQSGSTMVDLGTLAGDPDSEGFSINDSGQIVGFSGNLVSGAQSAVIWQGGAITDLNTLTPATTPWFIFEADGINRFGQIVGLGFNVPLLLQTPPVVEAHAVLLNPAAAGTTAMLRRMPFARRQSKAVVRPRFTIPENIRKLLEQHRKALHSRLPGRNRLLPR